MVVTFYNTASDPRAVSKTLGTSTGSATGVLHEKVNSINMTVRLPGTCYNIVTQSNYVRLDLIVTQSNYVMPDLTQKYYYIESYEVQNDCCYIVLKEDVLMSYATQIKAMQATVDRSASVYNGFLYDNGYEMLAYKKNAVRKFNVSLNNWDMILTTVG